MPVGFQAGLRLVDWVLSGASVDLDFANNRYFGSSGGSVTSYLSITRASNGYAQNSSGVWIPFSSNTLRTTDKGLLIEDARTNFLLQSETPATQTTASLGTGSYTLWVEGSGSALASGGSATITGAASATAGSPNTFNVTVAGTVIVTVSGSLTHFQLEGGSFATSLIQTTGTSATRAADNVTCIGSLATIFSALPQSVFADITSADLGLPDAYYQVISNNAAPNASLLSAQLNIPNAISIYNGTTLLQSGFFVGGKTLDSGVKLASSQATNQRSVVGGGGTVSTDTVTAVALVNASIGGNINAGEHFNGLYRRVTVWNSKLADAALQALTV